MIKENQLDLIPLSKYCICYQPNEDPVLDFDFHSFEVRYFFIFLILMTIKTALV